jgi:hypothetical protein
MVIPEEIILAFGTHVSQNALTMIDRRHWQNLIERAWRSRSVVWLAGVRRVGKTCLARSLEDVEYFDCELPRVRRMMEDPQGFWDTLAGKRVVLDEVHRLADPSQLLKIAADHYPTVRVLATGSSTLGATGKFRDTLAGRKANLWLTPMIVSDLRDFGAAGLEHRLLHGGLPLWAQPSDDRPAPSVECRQALPQRVYATPPRTRLGSSSQYPQSPRPGTQDHPGRRKQRPFEAMMAAG